MEMLDYDGLVEPWKVDLIVSRAKRLGFRRHDLEDVQQDLILDVARFRYDTVRSNGATEATALTALVDNRLKKLIRTEARYRAHLENHAREPERAREQAADTYPADVWKVVETLAPRERAVCNALAQGCSRQELARTLGCGWHTVNRLMRRIRERFGQFGFDGTARS